jgi:transposase-like protein
MHVIDAVLNSFSNLFRSHRYPPAKKLFSVILFTVGLSLRDLSERLCLTGASRIWVHRFSSLFKPSRRVRRLVAVDEIVLKVNGQICYLWCYRRGYWRDIGPIRFKGKRTSECD